MGRRVGALPLVSLAVGFTIRTLFSRAHVMVLAPLHVRPRALLSDMMAPSRMDSSLCTAPWRSPWGARAGPCPSLRSARHIPPCRVAACCPVPSAQSRLHPPSHTELSRPVCLPPSLFVQLPSSSSTCHFWATVMGWAGDRTGPVRCWRLSGFLLKISS